MAQDKSAIIQAAQKYAAKGQIQKAIEEWEKLAALNPQDGNNYNTIGDLYLRKDDKKAAIDAFMKAAGVFKQAGFALKTIAVYKKVIKVDPHRVDIYLKLGELNAERGLTSNAIEDYLKVARHFAKEGRTRESLEVYKRIGDLDPSNVDILLKVAELYLRENLKTEAVREFAKAAQAYRAQGREPEARDLFSRIRGIDPGFAPVEEAKPVPGPEAEEEPPLSPAPPAAELAEEKVAAPAPAGWEALAERGDLEGAYQMVESEARLAIEKGAPEVAEDLIRRYLVRDPKRIQGHELLGQILEQGGRQSEAVAAYADALNLILREEQSLPEAMEAYERIKQLAPDHELVKRLGPRLDLGVGEKTPPPHPVESVDVQAGLTEADVYIKYGLMDKAIDQLRGVLSQQPDQPEAWKVLKNIYLSTGDVVGAAREAVAMARLLGERGRIEQRDAWIREARALAPADPNLRAEIERLTGGAPVEAAEAVAEPVEPKASISMGAAEPVAPVEELLRGDQVPPFSAPDEPQGGPDAGPPIFDLPDAPEPEPAVPPASPSPTAITPAPADEAAPRASVEPPVDPNEISSRFAEAEFYFQQGLRNEARALYQQILRIAPDHRKARQRLSELTVEEELDTEISGSKPPRPSPRKPDDAFIDLARILEEELAGDSAPRSDPSSQPDQAEQQELEAIFQEFKRGIQKQFTDKDYEVHFNLGIAYKEMNLLQEAIEELDLASKGQERYVDAECLIATCFQDQGRVEEAESRLRGCLQSLRATGTGRAALVYELAQLLEKTGRQKEAEELYREVHQLDPNYRDAAAKVAPGPAAPSGERGGKGSPGRRPAKKGRISYL